MCKKSGAENASNYHHVNISIGMKRILFSGMALPWSKVGGALAVTLLLSSCYSSTVSVGKMKPNDPAVCVATTHEAHFLNGLIGSPKREAKTYVGDNESYRVRQFTSFTDGLLEGLTLGIYSPTTTKYYLPYGADIPARKPSLPVSFGLRFGLNSASMSTDLLEKSGNVSGVHLGAVLDVPITREVYFQPGLYYSQKGASGRPVLKRGYYSSSYSVGDEEDFSMKYIEIPLLLSYHYDYMDDFQIRGAVGPYIAYGIVGDVFDDNALSGVDDRIDTGIRLEAGVLYQKHYYAGLGYEWGLSKISDFSGKTNNVFVSIGYSF